MLLIDTANVVGSRPTGWWRDRVGAARQLIDRVRSATADSQLPQPVVMVLEGVARQAVEEGVADGVEIIHAPHGGDDTLAALAGENVTLVSADRSLGERVRRAGGDVVGPNWLLARLGPDR
jgi:rRNA-processing protein FCF1